MTQEINKQLNFGKYKGKTYLEVVKKDREYIYWLFTKNEHQPSNHLELLKYVLNYEHNMKIGELYNQLLNFKDEQVILNNQLYKISELINLKEYCTNLMPYNYGRYKLEDKYQSIFKNIFTINETENVYLINKAGSSSFQIIDEFGWISINIDMNRFYQCIEPYIETSEYYKINYQIEAIRRLKI